MNNTLRRWRNALVLFPGTATFLQSKLSFEAPQQFPNSWEASPLSLLAGSGRRNQALKSWGPRQPWWAKRRWYIETICSSDVDAYILSTSASARVLCHLPELHSSRREFPGPWSYCWYVFSGLSNWIVEPLTPFFISHCRHKIYSWTSSNRQDLRPTLSSDMGIHVRQSGAQQLLPMASLHPTYARPEGRGKRDRRRECTSDGHLLCLAPPDVHIELCVGGLGNTWARAVASAPQVCLHLGCFVLCHMDLPDSHLLQCGRDAGRTLEPGLDTTDHREEAGIFALIRHSWLDRHLWGVQQDHVFTLRSCTITLPSTSLLPKVWHAHQDWAMQHILTKMIGPYPYSSSWAQLCVLPSSPLLQTLDSIIQILVYQTLGAIPPSHPWTLSSTIPPNRTFPNMGFIPTTNISPPLFHSYSDRLFFSFQPSESIGGNSTSSQPWPVPSSFPPYHTKSLAFSSLSSPWSSAPSACPYQGDIDRSGLQHGRRSILFLEYWWVHITKAGWYLRKYGSGSKSKRSAVNISGGGRTARPCTWPATLQEILRISWVSHSETCKARCSEHWVSVVHHQPW